MELSPQPLTSPSFRSKIGTANQIRTRPGAAPPVQIHAASPQSIRSTIQHHNMPTQLHRSSAASPHHVSAISPSQILSALLGRRAAGHQAEMPSTQPDTGTTVADRHVDSDAVGPSAASPETEPSALQIKEKADSRSHPPCLYSVCWAYQILRWQASVHHASTHSRSL